MSKPLLVMAAPVATVSGYGAHSRDLALSLIKMDKFDVKFISTRWGNTPMNALTQTDPDHLQILQRILMGPMQQQPDVWIQISVPNEFEPVGKFNLGITAGIETTAIPLDWVHGCNKMNMIIVPSKHSRDVLLNTSYSEQKKDTGELIKVHRVEKPVEILFEGSDTSIYKLTKQIDTDVKKQLSKVKEDFAFLFVGHWMQGDIGHDRKDVGMMIKTFLTVFKNRKNPPALILKTSSATFSIIDRKNIEKKIDAIKGSLSGKLPNVYLLHGDLSPEQMNSLYNHPTVKCMVSFTKGEGYGRPLQEFAFTGKPIIASNWSGQVDFLENYALLVGGRVNDVHPSAHNQFIIKESKWFTVDYNEAAGIMDTVFLDYSKILEVSLAERERMVNSFSLKKMDAEFAKLMDKYVTVQQQVKLELPSIKLPKLKKINA